MLAAIARTKHIGGALCRNKTGGGKGGSDMGDGGARALLANACITGLLGSVFTLPLYALNIAGGQLMFSSDVCKGIAVVNQLLLLSLLTSSSAIAVHQCLMLVTRDKGRYTKIQTRTIMAVSWLFPAVVSGACISYVGFNERLLNCLFLAGSGHPAWVPISLIGVPTIATLLVTGLCYILVFRAAARVASVGCMPSGERSLTAMVISTVDSLAATAKNMVQQQQQPNSSSGQGLPGKDGIISRQVPNVPQNNNEHIQKSEYQNSSEGYVANGEMNCVTNVKKRRYVGHSSLKTGVRSDRTVELATKLVINWIVYAVIWMPLTTLYMSNETRNITAEQWLICSVMARLFCGVGWAVHGLWNKRLRMAIRKMFGCGG